MQVYFLGIDIGKRHHEACLLDVAGNVISKPLRFTNTQPGGQKLLNWLSKAVPAEAKVIVGMEATGHYWLALHTFLRKHGLTVEVVNPIQSDALRNLYVRQSKNDTKDAFLLAELIRFGRYSKTAIAAEDLLGLRQLTRFRFSLVDSIGDLKRQVIAIIDTIFPEYETLFSDIFGKTSTELLLAYSTPDEMLAVDTQDLTAFLAKHSRNQFGQAKAELVLQTARNTFGSDIALDAYSFQLRLLLQQIQFAEEQLQCLETEIGRRLEQFDQQLTTVPGIGPVLAASILAEVGDISRFNSPKQLVAFAGLDPSVRQSGQFQGTENHLSKRGSPYLRRAAWLAAMNARRFDPVFKAFYDHKMQRGKHSFTALGAVARKLISVVYAILRDNRPYSADVGLLHSHHHLNQP